MNQRQCLPAGDMHVSVAMFDESCPLRRGAHMLQHGIQICFQEWDCPMLYLCSAITGLFHTL